MLNPVFVALDTTSVFIAKGLMKQVAPYVGGMKIGLEYFTTNGPVGVEKLMKMGKPIFLDLKLHDIPATVSQSVKALNSLQPAVMTVHVAGGIDMMKAAKEAAHPKTRVVGVTMLTSLCDDEIQRMHGRNAMDQSLLYAEMARDAGLDGLVCSGHEVERIRQEWDNGFFVCPGIRPTGGATHDQKRIVTPEAALASGATILVVGRPITAVANPRQAAKDLQNIIQAKSEDNSIIRLTA